jgi:KaiC/GvpD/RAD55 family RecA-like ATPase
MERLKTGIPGFDEFLRGGLPFGAYLLLGPPGSGNEVFARQVAFYRSKQNGVSYITVAKKPESIKDDMLFYKWNISPQEKAGTWRFVQIAQVKSLIDIITREMREQRFIVIDSLSELLLTSKIDKIITLLTSMSTCSKENKELAMLLLTKGMHDITVETTIQHFVDGVIVFTTTWTGESSSRNLIIKKIASSEAPTRGLPYSLRVTGFTIETATRIT